MESLVFLFVAGWAAFGIFHMVRSGEKSRKYLASAEDKPLRVEHLSLGLQQFAQDTRFLRIGLEAPIRDVAEYREGEFAQAAGEDLDSLDNALMNVTRQVTEWVRTLERMPDSDKATLEGLGVGPERVRAALELEGWAFSRSNLLLRGAQPLDRRLQAVADELRRVETALEVQQQPYR